MRSVIRNIRILLTDPENYDARSELAWASAMAENGVLKIGKVTDFQAHQIQHQLGAYTDCNHGAADSTNITAGCCKKLTRDEICEILQECL